ncbi:mannose-1-phosphate guanylyltransferase/mannose-6-phosphate isomerase [Marivibrio halodurans]|uniref:mannose-1-phosphate guanylyltransferase n=1 Tax=Marivibrio halodurans TaxID=2039722 RepID=A0A8J7RWQ6_9PROT|nr:mannose-1-phosphate guanylyltransferase/mannose-6-phosphate isomerase [Marivibrio halodurans]MBP5855805.1 mannose-1-phosphate guanylyltransferase/mannose-6-phosphate isomerase [Marivibrio halodurans]
MTTGLIQPVILSGGAGTRLWPLSRRAYPKQFLPLAGTASLLQQTAERVSDPARFHPPLVIAGEAHRFIVRDQLEEAGCRPDRLVLEPVGRNTAAAVALAALMMATRDPASIVAILPSDHMIADEAAFHAALARAGEAAAAGYLTLFAMRPTRAETGYGYIRTGAPLEGLDGAFHVERFVEKPDAATAERFLTDGAHGWNSGMLIFRADMMLTALDRHAPKVLAACRAALAGAWVDLDFLRLPRAAFEAVPALPIDVAVMERTDRAAVVPADFGWNDLGAFASLHTVGAADDQGNVVRGDAVLEACRDSLVIGEDGRLVAAIGLTDMVVVATKDAVLVAPADRADAVRHLVARLEADGRVEGTEHPRAHRPWGSYEDIDRAGDFRVKRIVVKPGGRLSLQRHRRRSEHWIVLHGEATVTVGQRTETLRRNQSTYVPVGETHRLENHADTPLHLIEVQVGDYVGEDDIERLEDIYGRDPD